jgi:hypothetical protein
MGLCVENIEERLFEPVDGPQFPLDDEHLAAIGNKLLAHASGVAFCRRVLIS